MFDPRTVYLKLYQRNCLSAFISQYGPAFTTFMDNQVLRHCEDLFEFIEKGHITAAQLHKRSAIKFRTYLCQLFSNVVCLSCLRRHPERHLSCGHSLCDQCVAIFGVGVPRTENEMKVNCLFDDGGEGFVDLKPTTAGVRLIGIDGGGARGVTPLEFMRELQKLLGDCQLHDMIDLALGTSSGRSSRCLREYITLTVPRGFNRPCQIPSAVANLSLYYSL